MSPFNGSILAAFFVLSAIGCALSMLESWGHDYTRFSQRALTIFHKTCGYTFILIYITMVYSMLQKIISTSEPISPLATIHLIFAVMIFPLLSIKILIIRRFKGLKDKLPYFGVTIFTLALTLNIVTAGFYFLRSGQTKFVSLTSYDKSKLSADVGRAFMEKRCMKCHSLERVFAAKKTEESWTKTVNNMVMKDPTIETDQAAQIIFYLVNGRAIEPSKKGLQLVGLELTDKKCGRCHLLKEVYRTKRTKKEWASVVDQMVAIEPAWISEKDKKTIQEYLNTYHSIEPGQDGARFVSFTSMRTPIKKPKATPQQFNAEKLFTERCTECHDSKRIYKKAEVFGSDGEKWTSLVKDMIENGAEVSDEELPKIVEYLKGITK